MLFLDTEILVETNSKSSPWEEGYGDSDAGQLQSAVDEADYLVPCLSGFRCGTEMGLVILIYDLC